MTDRATAPKQGDEGAPDAWLAFDPRYADALDGIAGGDELLLLTWFDRAHRDVLRVHPRSDSPAPSRASSTPARRTARTRSACTASRCSRSTACGCA